MKHTALSNTGRPSIGLVLAKPARIAITVCLAVAAAACAAPTSATSSTTAPAAATSSTAAPVTTTPASTTAVQSIWSLQDGVTLTPPLLTKLEAKTYYIDADGLPSTTLGVEYTLQEPGWDSLGVGVGGPNGVNMRSGAVNEVASAACNGTQWIPVGDTAEDLSSALSEIEDFTVEDGPDTVSAFGYDGYHLVLETTDVGFDGSNFTGCDDGYFDSYQGPTMAPWYFAPEQFAEFWALDVEGTSLLIEANWYATTPAGDIDKLRAVLDTITIRP